MNTWSEYDSAAEWCARRGIQGNVGDPLPSNLSAEVASLIDDDVEAFSTRIRAIAYELAMRKHEL